jgi:hypothetical protein
MTTVDFYDLDGDSIGSVTVTGTGELRPDLLLERVTESWLGKGKSPADFAAHYDGWSNGYMTARIRDEQENTVTTTPKLGSGTRFKKLAAQLAAKGTSDPDAPTAATGRKPRKLARLAARALKSE